MDYINPKNHISNYLWMGIVENNVDPKHKGRIKVRVQSIFDDLSIEDIPWASPRGSLDGKSFNIPAVGKIVNVIFYNDNIYQPYYISSQNYNINLRNILNQYGDDEYKRFSALLFDDRTQIYADDSNLTLDYKFNKITISNNDINLELKDSSQKVNIGTADSDQQAVLGNHWFNWMDKFIQAILKPTSFVGNLGAPVLKPEIDQLSAEYQQIRKTFISDHVNIVDNDSVDKLQRKVKTDPSQQDRFLKINEEPVPKSPQVPDEVKDKIKEDNLRSVDSIKGALPYDRPKLKVIVPPSPDVDEIGYDLDIEVIKKKKKKT